MIAACIAVAALAALLAWREYLHTQERKQAAQERQELLDRIQAPEVVVQRRVMETGENLLPADPDMGMWEVPPDPEDVTA